MINFQRQGNKLFVSHECYQQNKYYFIYALILRIRDFLHIPGLKSKVEGAETVSNVPLFRLHFADVSLMLNMRGMYSLVLHWWLVRATYVVDGWFFGHFFWKVEGSSAHTHESRAAHMQDNCYMVEGTTHV